MTSGVYINTPYICTMRLTNSNYVQLQLIPEEGEDLNSLILEACDIVREIDDNQIEHLFITGIGEFNDA